MAPGSGGCGLAAAASAAASDASVAPGASGAAADAATVPGPVTPKKPRSRRICKVCESAGGWDIQASGSGQASGGSSQTGEIQLASASEHALCEMVAAGILDLNIPPCGCDICRGVANAMGESPTPAVLSPVTPEKPSPGKRKKPVQNKESSKLAENNDKQAPKPKKLRARVAKDKPERKPRNQSAVRKRKSATAASRPAAADAASGSFELLALEEKVDRLVDLFERLGLEDNQVVEYVDAAANGQLVPYVLDLKKLRPKVVLDAETTRMWNLIMGNKRSNSDYTPADAEDSARKWEQERQVMRDRAEMFISRMHLVQGDRRFSKWRGSIIDSIIGVYLTQNVSDHLSSSAFMQLAARFPPVSENNSESSKACCEEEAKCFHDPIQQEGEHETEAATLQAGEPDEQTVNWRSFEEEDIDIRMEQRDLQGVKTVRRRLFSEKEILREQPVTEKTQEITIVEEQSRTSSTDSGQSVVTDTSEVAILRGEKAEVFKGKDREKRKRTASEIASSEHTQGSRRANSTKWQQLRAKVCQEKDETPAPDCVNWFAVMRADVEEISDLIKERGMNNMLAGRIKAFLERVYEESGYRSLNLEWLRKVPPEEAKEFLLTVHGLGLKSVECIRLLEMEHLAFPVDTNVGRICVRLGWVPIEPLPEEAQLHLLNLYPVQATIQKYLWPRLCTLDQRTLYELHYQLITFGKVFCTKTKPNCNACPLRNVCKHYASAYASAKLALPPPEKRPDASSGDGDNADGGVVDGDNADGRVADGHGRVADVSYLPIIEEPSTPEAVTLDEQHESGEELGCLDIEDCEPAPSSTDDVVSIDLTGLSGEEVLEEYRKAIVVAYPVMPAPKLKSSLRLRTVHYVYELPDDHPLLQLHQMETRQADDPGFYLLLVWGPEDDSQQASKEDVVKGTILVPCRTAMRGGFPLNGTYFQVNEVFADFDSSNHPLEVPSSLIWNLRRRFVYVGTSVTSIFKGMTTEEIQSCFWRGYVCVRAMDKVTRKPLPLSPKFHKRGQ